MVVEGGVEETSSMVEEDEQICSMTEETEVPISGEEPAVSIVVTMHEAGPTMGSGRTISDVTAMSLLVTKDTERMSGR